MIPAVQFEGITKRFPGALALHDVSLEVSAGSCHALCGENGAGKSTLGRILAGIHAPDAGRVLLDGRPVRFGSPRDALAAGVAMVHQELAFCANLSVAENLCLGALPAHHGLFSRAEMRRRAATLLAEIGATMELDRPMGQVPIAQRQLVQIAVAVGGGARVIVFDEPTSSLSDIEAERLFALIARLTTRGVTCLYVSHRMPEVYRLTSTVSVLRDGRHVATRPTAGLPEAELVHLMIGRPVAEYLPGHRDMPAGAELLRVEGLGVPGRFEEVSFSLAAGEIVGVAGLVGAGRSELAQAIFGLPPRPRGRVRVAGQVATIRSPADAIRLGIGLVPEDRKSQGLIPRMSCIENLTLPMLGGLSRGSWVDRRGERALAGRFLERLRVRAPDGDAAVAGLSGGNQQKIVLARWLAAGSRILMLDEPTRGVDIGAKAEIHALIGELAAQGHGILLISSELPELLALSRRILVMRDGRLAGEIPAVEATQAGLLQLMTGDRSRPRRSFLDPVLESP